jgi:hypothetical protein
MCYKFKIAILFFLISGGLKAQEIKKDSAQLLGSAIFGIDTLPNYDIKEVKVFPKKVFTSKRQYRRYTRLIKNVKKAYPFALIARNELRIMNDSLQLIDGERAQKKYIKAYEKNMFQKYEDDLRKLTFSQGRILLKLVYREIGNTSYNLVKDYRGDISAIFWQGIARIFGSNLKSTYDPVGEDAEIEQIIQMIEAGVI